ncbi:hypothetical protein NC797_06970 [Aquibacillus sp. 3ASR75-11]|uniref:Uncharacterized protein n=1 Tax=Terrihalobacillus insolitus TaxID=2950438 RepID=A0A9X3WVT2_9BACI|nr:hypothetical protein [Terrihalobacillus insolitus]MDC3424249.1 hypothetical protein [Terrihalobacillus insolitus]
MMKQKQSFEVLEFKTQQEINADRRKKFEKKREELNKRVANIRNRSSYRSGPKTNV